MAGLILGQLLHLLWPALPAWSVSLLLQLVPFVIDLVRSLEVDKSLSGQEKLKAVLSASEKFIDERGDNLPGWHDLPEDQRDRVLRGLVEVILWVDRLGRKHGDVKDAKGLFAPPKKKRA